MTIKAEDITLEMFLEKFDFKKTTITDGKVMIDDNFFVSTAATLLLMEEIRNLIKKIEHARISLMK